MILMIMSFIFIIRQWAYVCFYVGEIKRSNQIEFYVSNILIFISNLLKNVELLCLHKKFKRIFVVL